MCDTVTANDILNWTRSIDTWCLKKVDRFNRILRQFYLDTTNIKFNYIVESLDDSWIQETEFPIYKSIAFIAEWCSDNDCILDFKDFCCGEWLNVIKMEELYGWELYKWSYILKCVDEIEYELPQNAVNPSFIYAQWPKELSSMNDSIEIYPQMRVWLEYLVELFYYETQEEPNKTVIARQNYERWLKKIEEVSRNTTLKIWTNGSNNKNFRWYGK